MTIAKPVLAAAFCSLFTMAVPAAIYQTVDEQGNVVFSDEPSSGATPVELPPLPTYSAPKYRPSPARDETAVQAGVTRYSSLLIQQPKQDATVRDNTGAVTVAVAIEPALDTGAGHRLQFYLDGQAMGEPGTATGTSFSNVDRGAHQIEVAVVDAAGKELKRSSSVTFYLHRQSINFPRGPSRPTPPRTQ